jgi:hypothetical protein
MDDVYYLEGPVEFLKDPPLVDRTNSPLAGSWIAVNKDKMWLPARALVREDGERVDLKPGQVIGIYADTPPQQPELVVALKVLPEPLRPPPATASMSIDAQSSRSNSAGILLFTGTAALIGLAIGAADGIVCRLPRRALLGGGVGLLTGFIGGFVFYFLGNLAYHPLTVAAANQRDDSGKWSAFPLTIQIMGRALAWTLIGMSMGLGQGIALRSKRLLMYGFIGGVIGGLLGGLLFDPIGFLFKNGEGMSGHISRAISITVIGLTVGAMIGIVELLARDAWLRMVEGPLAGKEFLLFKDAMKIGASPRCDIYLFNDPLVADVHATLRSVGDHCEIENEHRPNPILINGRPASLSRLRHGDQIAIGRTVFVFERRQGA